MRAFVPKSSSVALIVNTGVPISEFYGYYIKVVNSESSVLAQYAKSPQGLEPW